MRPAGGLICRIPGYRAAGEGSVGEAKGIGNASSLGNGWRSGVEGTRRPIPEGGSHLPCEWRVIK